MVAEHARSVRRYLPAAALVVLFLALTLWVNDELSTQRSTAEKTRLSLAQQATVRDQQIRDLAAQVRRLGGTPVVSPPPGPAGSPGVAGQAGASGATGRPGTSGASGAPGKPGASVTGPAGPKGDQGSAGDSVTGSTGPAGPAGPAGKDGADGKDGAAGKDGSPPSSWTWTDPLGITYTCTQTADDSTKYDCQSGG